MKESNKNIENSKKKNSLGYTVPSNYFDNFGKENIQNMQDEEYTDGYESYNEVPFIRNEIFEIVYENKSTIFCFIASFLSLIILSVKFS